MTTEIEANPGWTDERVAEMFRLQDQGPTMAQIAAKLGGGITRNSVISKIHRMGRSAAKVKGKPQYKRLKRKHNGIFAPTPSVESRQRNRFKQRETPVKARRSPPAAPLPIEGLVPLALSLLDLGPTNCRWPMGDPRDDNFSFCGANRDHGCSYCPHHMAEAYVKHQGSKVVRPFRRAA